ncbi:MAG: MATE family efflux transporter [Lachnospiraceae bacterium]|nr:MATE family efflux transporter [Lachnospiraceae bacterium]
MQNEDKTKTSGNDMTSGSPALLIIRFLIPLLIGNTFQQLYNMADTVIVGHFVGENALAAVGSTGTVMFLVMGICLGLTNGFAVLTSQRYGAKDKEGTRKSVANGMLLAAIIIVCMTVLSLLCTNGLLMLMNTPEAIFEDARTYISIIFAGIVCTVFYNLFSAFLRAAGNSLVPLYFLIFSAILNVVLDLLFIVVFGFGVAGAAIATDISQGISAILCWLYIRIKVPELHPLKGEWKLSGFITRKQLHIGLPMAIQFGITASGTLMMQSAVNLFGETAVAGFTAANKYHTLLSQGMLSMGQTMTSYAGQNYGVADIGRVRRGIRASLVIMFFFSLVVGAAAAFGYPYVLPLFFDADANVAAMLPFAGTYILRCAVCYYPLSLIFIFRNSMQACNYALIPTCCGVMEFFARGAAALLSMKLENYSLAASCDAVAWVAAGLFGLIAWLFVREDLKKKFG